MSDFSPDNTQNTAVYKGVLLPDGWTTNIPSHAHSFTVYDSVGYNTSDPVDYIKFTVPEGVTEVSVHMGVTLNGSNDIVAYSATLDGSKISGPNAGLEVTSQYTSIFQQQGNLTPGGYTAVYQVTPGDHYISVTTTASNTAGQSVEHSYSLDVQIASQTNVQPGTSPGQTTSNPGTPTTTNPGTTTTSPGTTTQPGTPVYTIQPAHPSQSYTDSNGTTWVPATDDTFAYHYGPGDTVSSGGVYNSSTHQYQAINHHIISGFSGSSSSVALKETYNNVVSVVDPRSGQELFSLENVEGIKFSDKTVYFLNDEHSNIARLYSAALGRAPDAGGLAFWEDNYDKNIPASAKGSVMTALTQAVLPINGLSIAKGFTTSPEFTSKYGSMTDAQYVTQLYNNVLGRGPEAAGLNGWLGAMHNGDGNGVQYTREMVLVGFAESAENVAKVAKDWLFHV